MIARFIISVLVIQGAALDLLFLLVGIYMVILAVEGRMDGNLC